MILNLLGEVLGIAILLGIIYLVGYLLISVTLVTIGFGLWAETHNPAFLIIAILGIIVALKT